MSESQRSSHLTSSVTLTRDDIIDGLAELVKHLHDAGVPARVQLVGGAAIALTIKADRVATRDVDGPLTPAADVLAAADKVARARGWPTDLLNDKAAQFVPRQRRASWPNSSKRIQSHRRSRHGRGSGRDATLLAGHPTRGIDHAHPPRLFRLAPTLVRLARR